MKRITLRYSCFSLAAACSIVVGFLAFQPALASAADSPHVRSTIDTSRCAACHSAHTASSSAALLLQNVTSNDYSVVCLTCHDGSDASTANIATGSVDSFGLKSGHSLNASSTGSVSLNGCSTCHDTHAAAEDGAMLPAKAINGVAIAPSSPNQVCIACHNASNAWTAPGYPSTSAPIRDAKGYPVLGTWPGPSTYLSTSNAHSLIPETTQTANSGGLVRRQQGDCLYCHAAHGGSNAYDGLLTTFTVPTASTLASDKAQGSYAELCFRCHGGVRPMGFATTPVDIRSFVTSDAPGAGHSIVTSGGTLPVGAPLPCFECHNPHGSKRGNASLISDERGGSLSATGAVGVRQFCFTCHTTSDGAAGWDSVSGAYVAVSSGAEVVGIPRDGGVLHLPAGEGHSQGNSASCYDCHGDDYTDGGSNVHNPSRDGTVSVAAFMIPTGVASIASDIVPPVTTVDTTTAFFGTLSLTASDVGGSGVSATYYRLDGSDATTGTEIAVAAEGAHTLQFWSVDFANNVEPTRTLDFLVDRTAPMTSSDATAAYVGTATITLTATDNPGGSGVAKTYYQLDSAGQTEGTVVNVSTPGPHSLHYWSVDNAGNVEANTETALFTISGVQALAGSPPLALLATPPLGAIGGPPLQLTGAATPPPVGIPSALAEPPVMIDPRA